VFGAATLACVRGLGAAVGRMEKSASALRAGGISAAFWARPRDGHF